jgi:hypothetical protein
LHIVNTGGSPITVTVAAQVPVLDEPVDDVVITVAAGGESYAGPFPHEYFAHPTDGLARITYSDAAHTQIAAAGVHHTGDIVRGTIITGNAIAPDEATLPEDLPTSVVWVTDNGAMVAAASPKPPTSGEPITSGTSVPTDLPDGSLYFRLDGGGVATDVYVTPGISAAEVLVAADVPTDLAPNQLAVVLGPNGAAIDLYVGGIS